MKIPSAENKIKGKKVMDKFKQWMSNYAPTVMVCVGGYVGGFILYSSGIHPVISLLANVFFVVYGFGCYFGGRQIGKAEADDKNL